MENYVLKYLSNYYKKGASFSETFFKSVENAIKSIDNPLFQQIKFEREFFTKSSLSLVRSLIRKIKSVNSKISLPTDHKSRCVFNKLIDKCLLGLSDFFRINICINDNANFTEESIRVLSTIFRIQGISLNNKKNKPFKNSFRDSDGCKDFKIYLLYNDYPFEIQLHNRSSEDINLNTHGIYEVYRAEDLKTNYKELLGKDRNGLYNLVIPPVFSEEDILKRGIFYGC